MSYEPLWIPGDAAAPESSHHSDGVFASLLFSGNPPLSGKPLLAATSSGTFTIKESLGIFWCETFIYCASNYSIHTQKFLYPLYIYIYIYIYIMATVSIWFQLYLQQNTLLIPVEKQIDLQVLRSEFLWILGFCVYSYNIIAMNEWIIIIILCWRNAQLFNIWLFK